MCNMVFVRRQKLEQFSRYRQVYMPGQRCCICRSTKSSDANVSFHRVPKEEKKQALLLELLSLQEEVVKPSTGVYSRHFPNGDASKLPSETLGTSFASPSKRAEIKSCEGKRATKSVEGTQHDAGVTIQLSF